MIRKSRQAFTLIELLVVVAMVAVLIGAFTSGIAKAERRSKISRAQTEAREITNAILAYQNFDEEGKLPRTMDEEEAGEGSLAFILGKVKSRNSDVPVLYNAALTGGKIRDPWGNPYRVTIKLGETVNPPGVSGVKIRTFHPNWHRVRGNN